MNQEQEMQEALDAIRAKALAVDAANVAALLSRPEGFDGVEEVVTTGLDKVEITGRLYWPHDGGPSLIFLPYSNVPDSFVMRKLKVTLEKA